MPEEAHPSPDDGRGTRIPVKTNSATLPWNRPGYRGDWRIPRLRSTKDTWQHQADNSI